MVDEAWVFATSARQRRAVADLLEGLDEHQPATPSLCAGWDVRTVAAHLVSAVGGSDRRFLLAVLRARGDLHRANDAMAREEARRPVADLVARLRAHADSRFSPPVAGPLGPLTDVLVHEGDMRVPLGLPHDADHDAVRAGLGFVTEGRPVGFVPRGRLAGLRLVARPRPGSRPERAKGGEDGVLPVLMVACGRRALLHRLGGPGVPVLARRLSTSR